MLFFIQYVLVINFSSSTPPHFFPPPLPYRSSPFLTLIRKEQASKITIKHDKIRYNKIKQKLSSVHLLKIKKENSYIC